MRLYPNQKLFTSIPIKDLFIIFLCLLGSACTSTVLAADANSLTNPQFSSARSMEAAGNDIQAAQPKAGGKTFALIAG